MADSLRLLTKFCHFICLWVLFFYFYLHNSCVYGARELASHQHANQKKPFMTASPCSASTKGLKVAHRDGPCSSLGQENPPPMSRDVRSLNSISSVEDVSVLGTILPLLKSPLGNGNFVVKVGIGTPKRDLTLMFDTGSFKTWIQCLPCDSCFDQEEPVFDPSTSSTFSVAATCASPPCHFEANYRDKSHSSGYYASDTLTFPSFYVPNVVFGCGQNNNADFGKVAGVLGVGLGDNSVMSQTLNIFRQMFCYCLPSTETSTGYLIFGVQAFLTCKPEITIPLTITDHYFVNLVGITIGQKRLEISSNVDSDSSPSTIIDSGTIISRLPSSVYSELQSSFQELMSAYPPAANQSSEPMDTCYNIEGLDDNSINNIVPSMTLHFDGSRDLNLDPSAVVSIDNDSPTVCLAFAANNGPNDLIIIGNHQQRNVNIYYNVLNKEVGFSTGGCST
ncbi:hypothetical protein JRO89_XS03G0239300 [Xanthoceras sorbifolium]|uniref:Peptidase A1 domain-containing protein n=1 Tax=Xanthoceras sorbifolium TaxID=99658 RepID=A0ABQ8IBJ6_9ROSI|nr:hypothetical protein JRO89_XS03G0239300 [Xanthoceras sorbifolium]